MNNQQLRTSWQLMLTTAILLAVMSECCLAITITSSPSSSVCRGWFSNSTIKLQPSDSIAPTLFGVTGLSASDDGNQLVTGGVLDNSDKGGTWALTRNATGQWSFIQPKIVQGTTAGAKQGYGPAMCSDGLMFVEGHIEDPSGTGSSWLFSRANTSSTFTATLQFTPNGLNTGTESQFGWHQALSHDCNVLAIGAPSDNSNVGAVFIYTRNNGVWSTTSPIKLVGAGSVPPTYQGYQVAVSGDGKTIATVGWSESSGSGWVWYNSSGYWSPQNSPNGPAKFVAGSDAVTPVGFCAVALSYDGNVLAIGANNDNHEAGAVWIYTRSLTSGLWLSPSSKLVSSTPPVLGIDFGTSVTLSQDGKMLAVGAYNDNGGHGSVRIYYFSPEGVWELQGTPFTSAGASGDVDHVGYDLAWSSNLDVLAVGALPDVPQVGAVFIFDDVLCAAPLTTLHGYVHTTCTSSTTGIACQVCDSYSQCASAIQLQISQQQFAVALLQSTTAVYNVTNTGSQLVNITVDSQQQATAKDGIQSIIQGISTTMILAPGVSQLVPVNVTLTSTFQKGLSTVQSTFSLTISTSRDIFMFDVPMTFDVWCSTGGTCFANSNCVKTPAGLMEYNCECVNGYAYDFNAGRMMRNASDLDSHGNEINHCQPYPNNSTNSTSSTLMPTTHGPLSSPVSAPAANSEIGVIIGAAVGGAIGAIGLVVLSVIVFQRRMGHRRHQKSPNNGDVSSTLEPTKPNNAIPPSVPATTTVSSDPATLSKPVRAKTLDPLGTLRTLSAFSSSKSSSKARVGKIIRDHVQQLGNKKYAIFISYHQSGAGSDANVIQEFLVAAGIPESLIFFDKTSLVDTRHLRAAVLSTAVFVQLQSSQVYFRPYTLIEAYVALANQIPVVPVALDSYKFDKVTEYFGKGNFTKALDHENPGASNELQRNDYDPEEVGKVLGREFPNLVSVTFSAQATSRTRRAQLLDILNRVIMVMGLTDAEVTLVMDATQRALVR